MRVLHMCRYFRDDLLDKFFPLRLALVQIVNKLLIHFRLGIFQREIVQLDLDLGNTEPLGDRRINVHRLFCFFFLLFRTHKFKRPHIVQTVRQFDDDHTDVFCHRKEHLA